MFYTGIGSRSAPQLVLAHMTSVGRYMASLGWVLRSGGASGADSAFENGVIQHFMDTKSEPKSPPAEIYIPWPGFHRGAWALTVPSDVYMQAVDIARKVHPAWHRCSQGAQKLHTRNVCQVLGKDLQTPSKVVLYYAPEFNGRVSGGTATAVNLARVHDIPTVNMAFAGWRTKMRAIVDAQ